MPSTMRLSSRFYCFEAPNELVDVVRKDIIHLCAFFPLKPAHACLITHQSFFSRSLFPSPYLNIHIGICIYIMMGDDDDIGSGRSWSGEKAEQNNNKKCM